MNETIAQYEFLERIADGGMASVFRILDRSTGQELALKRLHPERADWEVERALFSQEITILSELDLFGIPHLHDSGESEGIPWFTMDFIEGRTFREHLEENTLGWFDAADLLARVALLAAHIHDHGVVHRDLKPSNILVGPSWTPWIVDFGIGVYRQDETPSGAEEYILGTPSYLSPERLDDPRLTGDPRSDIYSLGVILYWILAGQLPFAGSTDAELFDSIRRDSPPRPESISSRSFPTAISDIAMRALARNPTQRYGDARGFAAELLNELIEYAARSGNHCSHAA